MCIFSLKNILNTKRYSIFSYSWAHSLADQNFLGAVFFLRYQYSSENFHSQLLPKKQLDKIRRYFPFEKFIKEISFILVETISSHNSKTSTSTGDLKTASHLHSIYYKH